MPRREVIVEPRTVRSHPTAWPGRSPLDTHSLRGAFMAWWPSHLRAGVGGEPLTPDRRRAVFFSYLPDWLISIALLLAFSVMDRAQGFRREFDLNDTSIQHTYTRHERVPISLCILLSVGAPIGIIALIALAFRQSLWDLHNGLLGLLLAESTTQVVTDAIKLTAGRPRPDLIDRCQPIANAVNRAVYGLSNWSICTQTDAHIMSEGWRSFISGHSSTAFSGLGFLSFYLAGKLHLFDRQGHSLKSWLSLAPLVGATMIAISRTMDYRHHATDVLAGSLTGLLLAAFAYFQYYPLLTSPLCHLPYEPRIPPEHGSTIRSGYEQLSHDADTSVAHGLSRPDIETAPRPDQEEAQSRHAEAYNLV